MYISQAFYGIKCDRCGDIHEDIDDIGYFSDPEGAWDSASDDGWIFKDGRHFCPACYTEDEEGNITIKNKFPDYLGKLRQFISCIIGHYPEVVTNDDCTLLTVKFSTSIDKELPQAHRDMIDYLLRRQEHTIEIVPIEGRTYSKVLVNITWKHFKVGDRVRIIDYANKDMVPELIGLKGTVMRGTDYYYVQADGEEDYTKWRWFDADDLELLTDE